MSPRSGGDGAAFPGASAAVVPPAAADPGGPVAVDPVAQPADVRARQAARAQAVASGTAVEVAGLTTAVQRTVANPDGTFTSTTTAGPVRFADGKGGWSAVDLRLVTGRDGLLRASSADPAVSPVLNPATGGVSLPTAAGPILAVHPEAVALPVTGAAARVEVPAESAGLEAVVPSALSGGRDWRVQLLASGGAKESVVLPTAGSPASYTVSFTVPAGVTAANTPTGVSFAKGGVVVASFGGGYAHDSTAVEGEATKTAVATRLVSQVGPVATVSVGVDPGWLTDPARVFPVVIDPSYYGNTSSGGNVDAYVDSAFPTTAEGSNDPTVLKVGTYNSGGQVTRSYLRFNVAGAGFAGSTVTDARLAINNFYSYACYSSQVPGVNLFGVGGAWSDTGVTWANQPAGTGLPAASSTFFAHGYNSSCPGAWEYNLQATSLAQSWADGQPNNGLVLGTVETGAGSSYGWKKFYSGETGSGSAPALRVTYTSNDPILTFESVTRAPGGVRVKGWAFDPNNPGAALGVNTNIEGTNPPVGLAATANILRPDVLPGAYASSYPGVGKAHGFDYTIPVTQPGTFTVRVNAQNLGAGRYSNAALGTTISNKPIGQLETVTRQGAMIFVRAWALDPDTDAAASLDVYVDNQNGVRWPATQPRTDKVGVGSPFSNYSSEGRGFEPALTVDGGPHSVCAYVPNLVGGDVTSGADNLALGCMNVVEDTTVDAASRCSMYAAEQATGHNWSCLGAGLTETWMQDGSERTRFMNLDTRRQVDLSGLDDGQAARAVGTTSVDYDPSFVDDGSDAGIDDAPGPEGGTLTPRRIDQYQSYSHETLYYCVNGLCGHVNFMWQIGIQWHSTTVTMLYTAVGNPVDVRYKLRLRHDRGAGHDSTVFTYPDSYGPYYLANNRSYTEYRYGSGYNRLPYESNWKVFLDAYAMRIVTARGTQPVWGSVQSERMTCYKTTSCKFK